MAARIVVAARGVLGRIVACAQPRRTRPRGRRTRPGSGGRGGPPPLRGRRPVAGWQEVELGPDPAARVGGQIPSSSEELDRSHRFGPATFRRYEWEQAYTTAGYVEVLLTYSGHRALDPAAQSGLLDCIAHLIDTGYGGRIAKRYLTELRVASTIGP